MNEAEAILLVLRIWAYIGAVVAVAFLTFGIDRIDEDARSAYVFRPLLIPGVIVIWPLVLWRWRVLETGRDKWPKRYAPPRKAHRIVGFLMPLAIIVIITVGWGQRQVWPADIAPERLSEAAQ